MRGGGEIFGYVVSLIAVGVLIGFGDWIIRNAADALIDDTLDLMEGNEASDPNKGGRGSSRQSAERLGNETTQQVTSPRTGRGAQ